MNALKASASDSNKIGETNVEWTDAIQECPMYRPTKEEFEDPFLFLQKIAPQASPYGVVLKREKRGFKFTSSVQPFRLGRWKADDKINFFMSGRKYTLHGFEKKANNRFSQQYRCSGCLPVSFLEKQFWLEIASGKEGTVEYAINVEGSAFSSSSSDELGRSKWNLNTLPLLPQSTLRLLGTTIPGVTDPMLYIGMLFSIFAWHVEDHYLYSINYHHCGAPKTWYGVPGCAAEDFERVVSEHVYSKEIMKADGDDGAFNILVEKTTMFSPDILSKHGVRVYKAVQMPGEFVITFPRAYHAGFSHGFNCAEAVNFAVGNWFPFGEIATQCYARLKRVPIIPYEELLCREALFLSRLAEHERHTHADWDSHRCVKLCFVRLIHSHHRARCALLKPSVVQVFTTNSQRTTFCCLCNRDCYVAYLKCNCFPLPTCLFHEDLWSSCPCGSNRLLYVMKDVAGMETLAQKYSDEEEALWQDKQTTNVGMASSNSRVASSCEG
ncbi:Zinc finger, C5HC2-type [Dillenia turbinata]|uniref:Zinc finger, C5HC2-type n=1 Tax=Dillenia turbinata TaxID=194707 RepID=A0AAN8V237_9MAGN